MKIKYIFAVLLVTVIFTGCKRTEQLTDEEKEYRAVRDWFGTMTDEDSFPDVLDYEYYARTLDLDSGYFLDADMWNIFYNTDINRNRDIDGKAVYLIALDTDKLLEVWADRNGTSPENICKDLGVTADELRYNFGYVEDLLKDEKSRSMLANSEFLVLLKQNQHTIILLLPMKKRTAHIGSETLLSEE